jgi:TatA/E family protein of Tat protein translocase
MLAEIFGPDLLIVVIVIAVLIFGGAAIPKLARSLGSAQGEFKKGVTDAKTAADATSGDAKATDAVANGSNPASAPAKADGSDSGASS